MKVNFLGTAGLAPKGAKATGARGFLCMIIDDQMMVETGEGAFRIMKDSGLEVNKIKRILISHVHPDHFLGIVSVLWDMWANGRTELIEIIGGEQVEAATLQLLKLTSVPFADPSVRGFDIKFIRLKVGESYDNIQTAKGIHNPEVLAFKIISGDRKLVFSGDTAYNETLVGFAKGVDLLIHESGVLKSGHPAHVNAEEAGRIAHAAGVKRLAIIHWAAEFEGREHELVNAIRKVYDGEIILPFDKTVIDF